MSVFKRPGSPYFYTEIQVAGRRVCRSTGTSTYRAAKAFERKLREDLKREAERIGTTGAIRKTALSYTVDQAFGRYWIEHANKLSWAHEVAAYGKRIVAIIGSIKMAELSVSDCAYLVDQLREAGTGKVAINRAIAVLRGCHTKAAKRWGLPVQQIDWLSLRTPEPTERVRWITKDEAALLLSLLPPHTANIVEFALYTGLRKREVVNLQWSDVNRSEGFFRVRVKGGKVREVLISAPAASVLDKCNTETDSVFDSTNLRKNFEAALVAANIQDFRFHDLRHTNATWLRREGASLEVVRRSLGHSSITVTQRYAHVNDQEVLDAANRMTTLPQSNVVTFKKRSAAKFVYFITDGDTFKIGKSSEPDRRLKTLQVGHPKRLWMIGTISERILTERDAHTRFSDCRRRGEWFVMTGETLKAIERLCRDGKSQDVGGSVVGLTKK